MIEHIWSVLCGGSSIDSDTKAISLFNVLEQLTVISKETGSINLPINLELFSLWTRADVKIPASGKMRTFFSDPQGNSKEPLQLEIDLTKANYFRSRVRIEGLIFSIAGRYNFVIELQQENKSAWVKVADIPILVDIRLAPPKP